VYYIGVVIPCSTIELMLDLTLLYVEMSVLGIHYMNVFSSGISLLHLDDLLIELIFRD